MTVLIVILVISSLITTSITIATIRKGLKERNKQISQRKQILAGGTSAQAVINSIKQTNAQVDDQPEVLLDLTVTMQDGSVIQTVVKTVIQIVNIPMFQKGNVIEVKHMTIDNEHKFEVVEAYTRLSS